MSGTGMSDDAATMRPMRWWDVEQVMGIESAAFATTAWSDAQFWSELAHGNRIYVVAEDRDGICGYAGVMVVPPTGDIQTISVAQRARRRGLGRRLLRALLDAAEAAGCTEVLLEVRADNAPAIAMYADAGFESIARRAAYYGPGEDALVMRRRP